MTPAKNSCPGTQALEIIEVQSGSYLGEDDIVRFEDTADSKVKCNTRVSMGEC